MHLKPEGAVAYARLLSQAFEWPIPSLEMTMTRAVTVEPPERLET